MTIPDPTQNTINISKSPERLDENDPRFHGIFICSICGAILENVCEEDGMIDFLCPNRYETVIKHSRILYSSKEKWSIGF